MNGKIKTIRDVGNLKGKIVLLRLDLNMPIVEGKIGDDFRLKRSLPTLEFLKTQGAKTIILSHTDSKETDSLSIVSERLKEQIDVVFVPSFEELPEYVKKLQSGAFLFLENIRRNAGEVTNDSDFAKKLASFGDIYVNDAFAVSHRAHASIVGLPQFLPSYMGLLLEEEITHLSRAFNPPRPFAFFLGGANKKLTHGASKSETKFPLLNKFLGLADVVFVGGALADDLFKAEGFDIGRSAHSDSDFGFEKILKNPKLILPSDVVTENQGVKTTKKPTEVLPEDNIVDAGPETTARLREKMAGAKFILWNGTLGICEKGFVEGTRNLAEAIIQSGAESIVGGGDTVSAIDNLGLLDKFSFISTGGGAMLDFLANETLPGIQALEKSHS